MITCILLALIYVQNSITMPHLVVIRLMRVIKWPRSDSDVSCVNKKGRGYKGFYSIWLYEHFMAALKILDAPNFNDALFWTPIVKIQIRLK